MAALILVLAVTLAGGTGEARADEGEALSPRQQAYVLWQQGYLLHLFGHYPEAIGRFQQSIDIHPTAENHIRRVINLNGRCHDPLAFMPNT